MRICPAGVESESVSWPEQRTNDSVSRETARDSASDETQCKPPIRIRFDRGVIPCKSDRQ